jgi:hypothetical protein
LRLHCSYHSASPAIASPLPFHSFFSLVLASAYDEICEFVFIHFSRDLTFYYVCALRLEGEKLFHPPPSSRFLCVRLAFRSARCVRFPFWGNKWSFKPRDIHKKLFSLSVGCAPRRFGGEKIPQGACQIQVGAQNIVGPSRRWRMRGHCVGKFNTLHNGAIFPFFTHDKLETFSLLLDRFFGGFCFLDV